MNGKLYVIRTTASDKMNKKIEWELEQATKHFGMPPFQFQAGHNMAIDEKVTRASILEWRPSEVWLCGEECPQSFKDTLTILISIQAEIGLTVVDMTKLFSPAAKAIFESGLRVTTWTEVHPSPYQ